LNLIKSTIPEQGGGNDPAINALDAPYAVIPQAASGAIAATQGFLPITKAGVAALTLPVPTAGLPSAGGNDGQVLSLVDTTGNAHTITTPSNGLNGNKHIATFGGTVGQFMELYAYNAVWYVMASSGVTLS
jgi:hypothetical protein